jgi:hypothetical protein
MTLNEIIAMAKELGVDFDKLVSVPHEGAIDIESVDVARNNGLLIRIF